MVLAAAQHPSRDCPSAAPLPQKDPKLRLRDIGEARILLEDPNVAAPEPVSASVPASAKFALRPWLVVSAALALALAGLAAMHFREGAAPDNPRVVATIPPPPGSSFNLGYDSLTPSISPEGRRIVFPVLTAGRRQLWLRSLESPDMQPIPGTEGGEASCWSPDGRSIAFIAAGKVKRLDFAGGPPTVLADAPYGQGLSWSPSGAIIFAPVRGGRPLMKVPASGGEAIAATRSGRPLSPWFLPDGRHFLVADFVDQKLGIYAGSSDSTDLKPLIAGDFKVRFGAGHLLYQRETAVMAQPFDPKRLTVTGEAFPVVQNVRRGMFTASDNLLLYQVAAEAGGHQLTWYDRSGRMLSVVSKPADILSLNLSPDRKSLVASVNGGNIDLWIYDLARDLPTRYTSSPAPDRNPIWSPDGRSIVYNRPARGASELYRKSADGTGDEERISGDTHVNHIANSWSPDGKFILYSMDEHLSGNRDVWLLNLTPDAAGKYSESPFLHSQFNEYNAVFSPDGRWVAFESDDTQREEIYVTPFPGPGPRRQVSVGGGQAPRWRADGKELYFVSPEGSLMAAQVAVSPGQFTVKQIDTLPLRVPIATAGDNLHTLYDLSADGQRFLIATPLKPKSDVPLMLIYNWLKR